ncbi:hypothetical protein ABIC83_006093 [Roseateles asaccharophilus]|uniref:Uncharacterized protein n=1 Tax=Roseateles asaccharophilus TaxID=582607 RepID=A0ABU2AG25_9BURK|nr:hypothetical protein [Roseateles asaccharophilus]
MPSLDAYGGAWCFTGHGPVAMCGDGFLAEAGAIRKDWEEGLPGEALKRSLSVVFEHCAPFFIGASRVRSSLHQSALARDISRCLQSSVDTHGRPWRPRSAGLACPVLRSRSARFVGMVSIGPAAGSPIRYPCGLRMEGPLVNCQGASRWRSGCRLGNLCVVDRQPVAAKDACARHAKAQSTLVDRHDVGLRGLDSSSETCELHQLPMVSHSVWRRLRALRAALAPRAP